MHGAVQVASRALTNNPGLASVRKTKYTKIV